MKINVDRLFMDNQSKIVKNLPLILELDAIKIISVLSIQNYDYLIPRIESGVSISGKLCTQLNIKWIDGEESTFYISFEDYDYLIEFIEMDYRNTYNNMLSVFLSGEEEESENVNTSETN